MLYRLKRVLASHLTKNFPINSQDYYLTYLGEALLSIHEDGVPLSGMFHWGEYSLGYYSYCLEMKFIAMIDNAEWGSGISTR